MSAVSFKTSKSEKSLRRRDELFEAAYDVLTIGPAILFLWFGRD